MHAPFWMGAAAVTVGILVLVGFRSAVRISEPVIHDAVDEGELVAVGDLD